MDFFDKIVENRIREAIDRGQLDDLPGAGKPLELDDDSMIAPELRAAYRILKNAGYLPPELALRRQIADAEQLLLSVKNTAGYARARARLELLRMQLDNSRRGTTDLRREEQYYQALLQRME